MQTEKKKPLRFSQNALIVIGAFEVFFAKPFKLSLVQYCEDNELLEQTLIKYTTALGCQKNSDFAFTWHKFAFS